MGSIHAPRSALIAQFDESQSGIIYTPPTFSDHLAVVCDLVFDALGEGREKRKLGNDKETKLCQPHKAQRRLASFFGGGAGSGKLRNKFKATKSKSGAVRGQPEVQHKGGKSKGGGNTLASFFLPQAKKAKS